MRNFAITLAAGLLALLAACSGSPAFADECVHGSLADVEAILDRQGAEHMLLPAGAIPHFLGIPADAPVVNVIIADGPGGSTLYGFELNNGCMTQPFVLQPPKGVGA